MRKMKMQQKMEILKIALLVVITVLLLVRGNEPQQPKINLSLPCDKQKCYSEASACAANPENAANIDVSLTCLSPLNCKNISYGGETLFINEKQSKCESEFEKCAKRCRRGVGM